MIVNEIFSSVSGEITHFHQGVFTTFVRLSGCNLKCSYCDTAHTQIQDLTRDARSTPDLVFQSIRRFKNNVVCITGGEPLIQMEEVKQLCKLLRRHNYKTYIETNGSVYFKDIQDFADCIVMDYKFDYAHMMRNDNIRALRNTDVLKFVFSDIAELKQAMTLQADYIEHGIVCIFAYSPVLTEKNKLELDTSSIIETINNNNMLNRFMKEKTVLSVQLHKLIGAR